MNDRRSKRSRLLASVEAGQQGVLRRGLLEEDFFEQLEAARARVPAGGYSARQWALWVVRGARASLGSRAEDGRELEVKANELESYVLSLDDAEFAPLRAAVRSGAYRPSDLFEAWAKMPDHQRDPYLERLLGVHHPPPAEFVRSHGMVHYGASGLTELIDLVQHVREEDVFFDLGCGIGKVLLWVRWLTGARTVGVEIDPAYGAAAARAAEELDLRIEVRVSDARNQDYADGTVFFLYESFRGALLWDVLARVQAGAAGRSVRLFAIWRSDNELDQSRYLSRVARHESGLIEYRIES